MRRCDKGGRRSRHLSAGRSLGMFGEPLVGMGRSGCCSLGGHHGDLVCWKGQSLYHLVGPPFTPVNTRPDSRSG